jgi:conjugal transfer/type IV secretion protein DotA/TraY
VVGQKPSEHKSAPQDAPRTTTRKVLRTMFHPEFGRSFKQFGGTFQMFTQLLAMLFATNGMLERNHPFLQPNAQFTIGDLFRETYARFRWFDKAYIPQSLFFIAVWGMLAAAVLWLVLLVFGVIVGVNPAHAQTTPSMFVPADTDLGAQYIDNLFFGAAIDGVEFGDSVQNAMRKMLAIFSNAILIFGSFILLYHVINMVVRAAWEGRALQGAGEIWAPLRLVLAIGMLVPLGQELNAAQHVVIYVGKMGSGLASFAWKEFSDVMGKHEEDREYVQSAKVGEVFRNMILANICASDVNTAITHVTDQTKAAKAKDACSSTTLGLLAAAGGGAAVNSDEIGAVCANDVIVGTTIKIYGPNEKKNSFYQYGTPQHKDICGEVTIPVPAISAASSARNTLLTTVSGTVQAATKELQTKAAAIAVSLVTKCYKVSGDAGTCSVELGFKKSGTGSLSETISAAIDTYVQAVQPKVDEAIKKFKEEVKKEEPLSDHGWAAAGAYFMKVSGIQGAISQAIQMQPSARTGELFNGTVRPANTFLGNNTESNDDFVEEIQTHFVKNKANYAKNLDLGVDAVDSAKSAAIQKQMAVFSGSQSDEKGTDFWTKVGAKLKEVPLFSIEKDGLIKKIAPSGADPFYALFAFGQDLYHASIIAISLGFASSLLGGIPGLGGFLSAVGAASSAIGLALFMPAFLLCFLLPIVPATKFLIGVFSWLGALFEALVGMPLFALAHLNPQGDSLIAPAKQGYSYLFSIMLKPLFIIFGLIAAVLLATIGMSILNSMYLVAINVMWGDGDVFIITAMIIFFLYGVQAYGVCNTCFKVIDHLPDNVYRWFIGQQGYDIRDYDDKSLIEPLAAALVFKEVANSVGGMGKSVGTGIGAIAAIPGKNRKSAREGSDRDLQRNTNRGLLAAFPPPADDDNGGGGGGGGGAGGRPQGGGGGGARIPGPGGSGGPGGIAAGGIAGLTGGAATAGAIQGLGNQTRAQGQSTPNVNASQFNSGNGLTTITRPMTGGATPAPAASPAAPVASSPETQSFATAAAAEANQGQGRPEDAGAPRPTFAFTKPADSNPVEANFRANQQFVGDTAFSAGNNKAPLGRPANNKQPEVRLGPKPEDDKKV